MAEKNAHDKLKQDTCIKLLMIGKSGVGKTSTGNSIIGEKKFVHSEYGGIGHCQSETTKFDDRFIQVVNTPGIIEASQESEESDVDTVIQAIASSFNHAPEGFNALLLVLSYTARFTEEEKVAVQSLKSILGEDVFRKHTICIFTHGDSFQNDFEDEMDFETWCKEQNIYKDLFEDCQQRAVLFDNRTRDVNEKRSQLMELLTKIDSIPNDRRYTEDKFKAAEKSREKFITYIKIPLLLQKAMEKSTLINEKLNSFASGPQKDWNHQIDEMKGDLSSLMKDLPESDHPLLNEFRKEIEHQLTLIKMYEETLLKKDKLEKEQIKAIQETREREVVASSPRQNELQDSGMMSGEDREIPKNAHDKLEKDTCLNLLMIGKSGVGKTSTGNSIIGEKKFVHSAQGGIGHCQCETTKFDDRFIQVVNTPGIIEASQESEESDVDTVIQAIASSFNHAPEGFNALLLVLSYTARFTEEEKVAVQSLKSILGEDVFRKHTICVFTHGDSFQNDFEDEMDFETWCKEQNIYKDLFEDCQHRVVLFDNRTRDVNEKRSQLMELLTKIDSIPNNRRYTEDKFKAAEKSREKFITYIKIPLLLQKPMEKSALINGKLNRFARGPQKDWNLQIDEMKTDLFSIMKDLPESDHPLLDEFMKEIEQQHALIKMYEETLQKKGKLEKEQINAIQESRGRKQVKKKEKCNNVQCSYL